MQKKVGRVVLIEVVIRNLVGDGCAEQHGGLVRPAPRDISNRIAATSEHQEGKIKGLNVFNAGGMALENMRRKQV